MLLVTSGDARRHRLSLRDRAEGLLSTGGYRFLIGVTEAATDTSFEAMKVRQQALVDVLKSDPAIDYINSSRFGGPNPTANYGRLFIALKPQKQRDGAAAVIGRLRQKLPNSHAGLLPTFRT